MHDKSNDWWLIGFYGNTEDRGKLHQDERESENFQDSEALGESWRMNGPPVFLPLCLIKYTHAKMLWLRGPKEFLLINIIPATMPHCLKFLVNYFTLRLSLRKTIVKCKFLTRNVNTIITTIHRYSSSISEQWTRSRNGILKRENWQERAWKSKIL